MRRSWEARVDDMVAALDEIERFVAGMDYEEFLADPKTQKAVLADLWVLAETAERVGEEFTRHHRTVPWDHMRAFRETFDCARFTFDIRELWRVARAELPRIATPLRRLQVPTVEDELPAL
jgi:uncharacterized protein with HEPN domain